MERQVFRWNMIVAVRIVAGAGGMLMIAELIARVDGTGGQLDLSLQGKRLDFDSSDLATS